MDAQTLIESFYEYVTCDIQYIFGTSLALWRDMIVVITLVKF